MGMDGKKGADKTMRPRPVKKTSQGESIMKRALSVILIVLMVLIFSGCDSSDYKKATELFEQGEFAQAREIFAELADYEDSQEKVKLCDIEITIEECNNAIANLGLTNSVTYYDVLFSLSRFEKAFNLYYSVPEEYKDRITDAQKLLAAQTLYEQCRAEEEIENQVTAEAIKVVKDYTSKYAAISTFQIREDKETSFALFWDDEDPTLLNGSITLYYSYANKYGGTEDREEMGFWDGKYENGVFEITKMSFYGLEDEVYRSNMDLIKKGLSLFG